MAEHKIKKEWYKRWWAIVLYVFVGLIILGSIFGGNNPSNSSQGTNQNSGTDITQQPAQTIYSIGDSIKAGDFTWKITKVSTASQIGEDVYGTFFGEKADGVFVILDVEVSNTGNSAKYLMDSYLKLIDDQNREFSPNSAVAIYLKPEGSALMFEQVNPGITKKGKIVFDVPAGLKVANVRISSNLLSSSFYNIKLTI